MKNSLTNLNGNKRDIIEKRFKEYNSKVLYSHPDGVESALFGFSNALKKDIGSDSRRPAIIIDRYVMSIGTYVKNGPKRYSFDIEKMK